MLIELHGSWFEFMIKFFKFPLLCELRNPTLRGAEMRYPQMEKLAFALFMSVKKLKQYFEAHQVVVRTDQLLRKVLQKAKTMGRLVECVTKIGGFGVTYEPRKVMKT